MSKRALVVACTLVLGTALFSSGCSGCGPGRVIIIYDNDGGGGPRDRNRPADQEDGDGADGADGLPPPKTCTEELATGGCQVGPCQLTGGRDSLAAGVAVTLAAVPLPADLAGDALGKILCDVQISPKPPADEPPRLTLGLDLEAAPATAAVLFGYSAPDSEAPSWLVSSSMTTGTRVTGLIGGSGLYGATLRPSSSTLELTAGTDVSPSADEATRLRNLTRRPFGAAFYDGQRLYLGNGNRVLIYNSLPPSPVAAPDVVLGQPDLDSALPGFSSSVIGGTVNGLWSDGNRLVVSASNRVLIWRSIPQSSFTPADVVLGQSDFSSNESNAGGVSASSLAFANGLDSDGTRLAVADTLNHRVLIWESFPDAIGEPASSVIGQQSLQQGVIVGGAAPLYQAFGVALDRTGEGAFVTGRVAGGVQHIEDASAINPPYEYVLASAGPFRVQPDSATNAGQVAHLARGALAVRDGYGNRIGIYRQVPDAPTPMSFALGQPDSARAVSHPVSASTVNGLEPSLSGGTHLLVPDGFRVLMFDDTADHHFAPAVRVFGQPGFTTNEQAVDYRAIGGHTQAQPADVAASPAGDLLAVADRGNNRVLLYRKADLAAGAQGPAAGVVLGQPDPVSYLANGGAAASAASLSGPSGVATDGQRLVVADTENHRVLIWRQIPTQHGAPADLVLGQASFTGQRPGRGAGDLDGDGHADADGGGMFAPTGVALADGRLAVADRLNHRVLIWNSLPAQDGQAADLVLGQASATEVRVNRGQGLDLPAADGFNLPTGVLLEGDALWVADTENNRVVRYDGLNSGAPLATAFLGQPDGVTATNLQYFPITSGNAGAVTAAPPTHAGSVIRPRGLARIGDRLYVSEPESQRVHLFDALTLAPVGRLGQRTDDSALPNDGGLSAGSLNGPQGLAARAGQLLVADGRNHRVLGFSAVALASAAPQAALILGQPGPVTSGFNQGSVAAGGATRGPRGLHRHGGQLFVADTDHHRVLVLASPLEAGADPLAVFGQPDGALALPNSGGAPSAVTLRGPRAVFADDRHVVVADSGNHRVLIYERTKMGAKSAAPEATLVLGQADFAQAAGNRGGAAGPGTLLSPAGVHIEGERLFVADTGNHRVLVWEQFPTSSGQPADLVLGQADAAGSLLNRGLPTPAAETLASPGAVLAIDGHLFVADSGNNRVLRFESLELSTGEAATGVLGQPDLTSRITTADPHEGTLGGPVALASEGTLLYVADRDLRRVVAYALPAREETPLPVHILGGPSGLAIAGAGGLAVEPTGNFTTRVTIADTAGDRLLVVGSVSRLLPTPPAPSSP